MKVIEIVESVGLDTQQMAEQIFAFAEDHVYNAGAEGGGGVNDDDILRIAQQALAEIENFVSQKIEDGRMDSDAETEHQMGADRNMEMGETNFKDPDRF